MDKRNNNRSILIICNPKQGKATMEIRGVVFRDLFINHSWTIDFVSLSYNDTDDSVPVLTEEEILTKVSNYNYIYLLKVNNYKFIKKIRKKTDSKIIFDFTDALWRPSFRLTGWRDINKILKASDVIFSENDYVCNHAYKYNKRVINIPAYLPIEQFADQKSKCANHQKENVVIGWVGSESTVHGFVKMKHVLETIYERHRSIEFLILGCSKHRFPITIGNANITFVAAYDEKKMVEEVLKMDIGLFHPSFDIVDYKIRGALKGMIYMAAGIPAIFQASGDCLNFVEDGYNAMLAKTEEDWIEKLELLISDEQLRRNIGQNGFNTVCENHSLNSVYMVLERALLTVGQMYIPDKNKKKQVQGTVVERLSGFVNGWVIVYGFIKSKIVREIKRLRYHD